MNTPIKVNYEYTNNVYKASKWLERLPELFAADFEVASKFTKHNKNLFQYRLNHYDSLSFEERRLLNQYINSNGLSHASLTVITHLSVGWSDRDAYVIICDSNSIRNAVCNYLVSTKKQQLWHNCIYDFSRISYLTKHIPTNFIDTQLLAKTLLNNANSSKDDTRLKSLMAYAYGDWAISKDEFVQEEMWQENVIRYSATDACATYKLYTDIMEDIGENNENDAKISSSYS